jgi:hypothetical protein
LEENMHRTRLVLGFTALFLTMGVVVTAGQGRGGAKPQQPTTSPHTTSTMKPAAGVQPKGMKPATSPKAMKPVSTPGMMKPASTQKPMKAASAPETTKTSTGSTMKAAKTTKAEPVKLAKTEKPAATKVAKADKPSKSTDTTTKTTTVAPTPPPGTTTTVVLTPVQEKLQKNTNLASKLASRLPAGTDMMKAADGFRNLGQFVAAVNVSHNLGIPFDALKTSMVTDGKSLGQSIQALKPVASSTIEAQHAEFDARVLIAESEQQPQVTTTATSTTTSKSTTKTKKPGQ